MDRAQLYKLTELIVAEVVRRIAQEERRRQHPEQVLVLLADSVSFPEKLQQTLNEQFGVAYTPVSIPETNTFTDEALLCAGKLADEASADGNVRFQVPGHGQVVGIQTAVIQLYLQALQLQVVQMDVPHLQI